MPDKDRYIWEIPEAQTMSDKDRFFIVVGTSEYLISKDNLSKLLSGLSSEDKNKLQILMVDGDGTRFLTDMGQYSKIIELFSKDQFKENAQGLLEISGYHTHDNKNVLDNFSTDDHETLLYNGQILSGGAGIENWKSSTIYSVDDIVLNDNTLYKCVENHTSGNTFDNYESEKWTSLSGDKGDKGEAGVDGSNGEDGFSPTITSFQTETGVILTITNKESEPETIEIKNGEKGKDGITTITTNKIDKVFTLLASDWSDSIPYTQTVQVEGITEKINPIFNVVISDDISIGLEEQKSFGCITKAVTSDKAITAYCYQSKPTVDLNIMVGVV